MTANRRKRKKKKKPKQKTRAKNQAARHAPGGSRAASSPSVAAGNRVSEADSRYSWWVVAFLDLLGYRTLLARIDLEKFPTSDADKAELKKGFVDAIWIRRRLALGINEFNRVAAERIPQAPKVLKSLGGDHVALARSLDGPDPLRMLWAIESVFVGAAVAALLQLEYGEEGETLPLRGGIDIGVGVVAPRDEFVVSPAVARAYELENKAVVARVLIGSRVHNALRDAEVFLSGNPGHPEHDVARRLVASIRSMIFVDDDGLDVLDFFGPRMRSLHLEPLARSRGDSAWRYALAMEAKFRAADDEKITAKYSWLVNYMRPRLSLWGVSVEQAVP